MWELTGRSNAVAVLSNGTAVLGLGNIGLAAALPVMEGKAVLFKQFGGVNLEDIKAPECFEIERRLQDEVDIPVFHDDQHGTAIVALINAAKVVGKRLDVLTVAVVDPA